MEKICWQITVAAFMQPLQYDLWSPAAKDNSITHAAKRGSNTCNPIYIAGTILQLQITMEFCRPQMHEKHLTPHLQCGTDPNIANHNGISSATHPGAPLAIPFTLRERSYSCKSQWNSVDCKCTKNTWNPIYNAEPIRTWSENDPNISEHDPTTHETVSHPSHSRGRSPRFGDALCMEKHRRASAISQKRISCETSFKTPSATPPAAPLAMPFASRERSYSCKSQWNSICNSSTSTTCNPIYIAGTILQLQITMEFCRPQMHEKHLTPHLQCGTDPNMIREWSEHIRTWSDHTRDRLAPVAQQR